MQPYLIEGLDCSGKKTIADLVVRKLASRGLVACVVVGPVVGGLIGSIDSKFANLRRQPVKGSVLDILRRSVYALEPAIDGLFSSTTSKDPFLKVSSHFRAWARAEIEKDKLMLALLSRTRKWHIGYGAGTLMTTDFEKRLERHRLMIERGFTKKEEAVRFLGPNKSAFERWDMALDRLMSMSIPSFQRLDTTTLSEDAAADIVASHVVQHWC